MLLIKLPSSRLWKKALCMNPALFIVNGSTAHTARIVLTFLRGAFKDLVISYRIAQGQICMRCFCVVKTCDYSRRYVAKEQGLCEFVTKHFKTYGRENVSKLCNCISDGLCSTAVINCGNCVYHFFLTFKEYAL